MRTPRVTVFTPSHRNRFLDECLRSLLAQTYADWEWVVVLNQGARWRPEVDDPRVRILVRDELTGVGAAKRYACDAAAGEIFVELDHDDILTSDCLSDVVEAFDTYPDVGFVYSDTALIGEDGSRDNSMFPAENGWQYREEIVDGVRLLVCASLPPTPHNVSYIWYAPNHVRAFRRDVYEKVGGYDEALTVADDHDLMCRMFQVTDFHHIPACRYLQRMHARNTQRDLDTNALIQQRTVELYDRHLEANSLAWAARRGLYALDLASGTAPEGYLAADITRSVDLPDSSVGVIRAVDVLARLPDKVALFNELYRLLAPNGLLLSLTPSTDGRGAFQDPTHVSYYNENSFWYYTDASYSRYVPRLACRFQVSRLVTYYPSEWHAQNRISYVNANLIAIKDDERNGGRLTI
jgi:O-antigen biosynthesis protein